MPERTARDTDVYVDAVAEGGLLFLELVNDGDLPATAVRVKFDQEIVGPGGDDLRSLHLWRGTEFLAPGRRIRTFVDTVASYFGRRQPDVLTVGLQWASGGRTFRSTVRHDLRIHRDRPDVAVVPAADPPPPGAAARDPS